MRPMGQHGHTGENCGNNGNGKCHALIKWIMSRVFRVLGVFHGFM
jgi:hypothetical protein